MYSKKKKNYDHVIVAGTHLVFLDGGMRSPTARYGRVTLINERARPAFHIDVP